MKSDALRELLARKVVIFDGATGTMLQEAAPGHTVPDLLNMERPEIVQELHRAYVDAGAEVILTNTLGASPIKLEASRVAGLAADINARAAKLAKVAAGDRALVAGDIGPTGRLVEPLGDLSFWDAYDAFRIQAEALAEGGVDLILIETMSDLKEAKAALLAAKEATGLPVIVTMTFDEEFVTPTGTDPATAANVLASMGAFAVGANCSTGPRPMVEVIGRMAQVVSVPILAQPNAGLPELIDGRTVFSLGPEGFAGHMERFVAVGAGMVGGCCGTTPEHIRVLIERLGDARPVARSVPPALRLSSRMRTIAIGGEHPFAIVGERINPTNREDLTTEILDGRTETILRDARGQIDAGAHVLDVNVGVPGADEVTMMRKAALAIENSVSAPLSIDSVGEGVFDETVVALAGKPLLNSVTGAQERMDAVLPLAARFGTGVVCLALDESGIKSSAEARVNVLRKIIETAERYGVPRGNLILDTLTLALSAEQERVPETLKAVGIISRELKLPTILGVSNVSHGLPDRGVLNASFLAMAMAEGLDAAIMNPLDERMMETLRASSVLTLRDRDSANYIREHMKKRKKKGKAAPPPPADDSIEGRLRQTVIDGATDEIEPLLDAALAAGQEARALNDTVLIPALQEVGRNFEKKECFLPQMMLSAETVERAFRKLKPLFPKTGEADTKGTVVVATVEGDVHDIGKNILASLMEGHGYAVVDLGRNVPAGTIVEAAKEHAADVVALSALMTTTVTQIPVVLSALKDAGLKCKTMVGGAVVTKRFAKSVGADGYAKDAAAAMGLLEDLLRG
jgi:5-methyltetrahydrofolate--homocysteine methyltransferase